MNDDEDFEEFVEPAIDCPTAVDRWLIGRRPRGAATTIAAIAASRHSNRDGTLFQVGE